MQALRDSIHRNILVEDWAIDLIDTREVQRLRRIRQLGTAFLVYPGANHTRFEHSLGAYKLAQDATRALGLPADTARAVQAAALLHDVGHGPLSHLFEDVVPGRKHEEFTADLIQWSGLNDRLKKNGIDTRRVVQLIQGKTEHGRIVSGDIDVDRMDYLIRDAHYTGVRVSVDPERLLAVMTLQDGDFLVREEGLTAAESLLVARFLMYPSVYFHHACRSGEAMVVAALRRLVDEGAPYDELRVMDDVELFGALKAGSAYTREIGERIDDRRLFKRAVEGNHRLVQQDPELARRLGDEKERAAIEQELADAVGLNDGYVLLDVPPPPLVREVGAKLLTKDGRVVGLKEASTLVRTLVAAQMDHWKFWVFTPRDYLEPVARECKKIFGDTQTVKPSTLMGANP